MYETGKILRGGVDGSYNNKKRYFFPGFTLAETLITLAIIGLVAALTISSITANYRKHVASTRIKKIYSALTSAYDLAFIDGKDWEYYAKSSSTSTSVDNSGDAAKVFADKYLLPYLVDYKAAKEAGSYYGIRYNIYLNDGSVLGIYKGECIDFIYDLNGEKKPNTYGKDIFRFLYCSYSIKNWIENGKIIPYQLNSMTTREKALEQCKTNAVYCSGLLQFDNWEFKKDYPYNI